MKIIFQNENGGVSVVHPVPQEKKKNWPLIKDEEYLQHVIKRSVPPGVNYKVIEDHQIPVDRTFRDAWNLTQFGVAVNMTKAKAIHMKQIRRERNQVLNDSDWELLRELEKTLPPNHPLRKKRQDLRDIPSNLNLDAANSPEELKKIRPKELPPKP